MFNESLQAEFNRRINKSGSTIMNINTGLKNMDSSINF